MSEQGILTLLRGLQNAPGSIAVLFDSYGGQINKVASDATPSSIAAKPDIPFNIPRSGRKKPTRMQTSR